MIGNKYYAYNIKWHIDIDEGINILWNIPLEAVADLLGISYDELDDMNDIEFSDACNNFLEDNFDEIFDIIEKYNDTDYLNLPDYVEFPSYIFEDADVSDPADKDYIVEIVCEYLKKECNCTVESCTAVIEGNVIEI